MHFFKLHACTAPPRPERVVRIGCGEAIPSTSEVRHDHGTSRTRHPKMQHMTINARTSEMMYLLETVWVPLLTWCSNCRRGSRSRVRSWSSPPSSDSPKLSAGAGSCDASPSVKSEHRKSRISLQCACKRSEMTCRAAPCPHRPCRVDRRSCRPNSALRLFCDVIQRPQTLVRWRPRSGHEQFCHAHGAGNGV
jgi:hypothetical protein